MRPVGRSTWLTIVQMRILAFGAAASGEAGVSWSVEKMGNLPKAKQGGIGVSVRGLLSRSYITIEVRDGRRVTVTTPSGAAALTRAVAAYDSFLADMREEDQGNPAPSENERHEPRPRKRP